MERVGVRGPLRGLSAWRGPLTRRATRVDLSPQAGRGKEPQALHAGHSTVMGADSVAAKPSSPVHRNSIVPVAVATVKNVRNGLAAIAGEKSARNISSPL